MFKYHLHYINATKRTQLFVAPSHLCIITTMRSFVVILLALGVLASSALAAPANAHKGKPNDFASKHVGKGKDHFSARKPHPVSVPPNRCPKGKLPKRHYRHCKKSM
ncbi:hypothetical protein BC938DRAFT_480558 [Jimgerdemannia flammicorona]|uniref:Uncharacterized protein n=1 Tax=Jimgerdemannia flammicorona TaxID=994334 RepID=A0A433QI73_9FUNG|nr:hypothetical protein BC938DRAFT_480558 [Jimgerdemannia flammicorona]